MNEWGKMILNHVIKSLLYYNFDWLAYCAPRFVKKWIQYLESLSDQRVVTKHLYLRLDQRVGIDQLKELRQLSLQQVRDVLLRYNFEYMSECMPVLLIT